MSCSSAVTIRRSRSSKPASVARRSAARCVATPCRRKRSGAASQVLERSKKSKVRARVASAWTASGERTSTALTMDSTRPRPRPSTWLARRSTEMIRATSDSTAATISAVDTRSAPTTRRRRLRDSARAGNDSSASKAAVRRRPWPSLWRPPPAACAGEEARIGTGAFISLVPLSGAASMTTRLSAGLDVWLSDKSPFVQYGVHAPQRLLLAEQLQGLENAWRDGGSDHRDADRLEDVLGLGLALLDHPPQRLVEMVAVPFGDLGEHLAGRGERGAPVLVEPLVARLGVMDRAVVDRADQGPEVGQRLDLLARRGHRRGHVAVAVQIARDPLREVRHGELADVAAVHPAQLLLVEARRVALHALEVEALDQLLGRDDRLVVGVAPPQQGEVVAHSLGQVAGVAQLLHGGRAMALGELLAVGAVQQRQVGVDRLLCAQSLEDEQLL